MLPRKSPRKRQGASRPKAFPQSTGKEKKFASGQTMRTALYQMDEERRGKFLSTEQQYLQSPPEDENLFEAILVLPEHDMLLRDLSDAASFDAIRTQNEVWIKQDKRNVLHIYSRTIKCLQEGFKATNWAVHDARLARQNISAQFLVQMPVNTTRDSAISVNLDSRPQVEQLHLQSVGIPEVAADVLKQLGSQFFTSTTTLQTTNRLLHMQVDFGNVIIRRRKKGVGSHMTYLDFAEMALQYGNRGGADLVTTLADVSHLSKLKDHLLAPGANVYMGHEEITYKHSIRAKIHGQDLTADIDFLPNGLANLTTLRLVETDQWPPLKWIVIAPDRKFDWSLRVDGEAIVQPLPQQVTALVKDIVVRNGSSKKPVDFEHQRITVDVKNREKWNSEVEAIHQKSSVLIPFRDTPFVVEVSRNHLWKGADTKVSPQSWLGIQFFGLHWDDALNYTKPYESRKYWGDNQCDIWDGPEGTAERRFEGFICHILEVMAALEGANINDGEKGIGRPDTSHKG